MLGASASGSLPVNVDDEALAYLMAELTDPVLQGRVLRRAASVANADRHLAEGEVLVLEAARRHWPGAEAAAESGRTSAAPHAA